VNFKIDDELRKRLAGIRELGARRSGRSDSRRIARASPSIPTIRSTRCS